MLDKLKNLKEHIIQGKHAVTFDASRFNDPLASQIQWTALKSGGSNFQSHKLVEVTPFRLEFQPSIQCKLFSLIFILAGIALPLFYIKTGIDLSAPDAMKSVGFMIAFGLIFIGTGYFFYRKNSVPIVIDKNTGRFWKGRKGPDENTEMMNSEMAPKLGSVHAIQLLSEYRRSDKNSYYIYETNFVMEDTRRFNVMRHGSKKQLRKDAETLSQFIGKPVWDVAG